MLISWIKAFLNQSMLASLGFLFLSPFITTWRSPFVVSLHPVQCPPQSFYCFPVFCNNCYSCTKNKFSIRVFFSKCDQTHNFQRILLHLLKKSLKLVSTIFYQIFISHQMIALQKLWKMLISSKKLFSFSRCSNFCISVFPYFPPVSHCFKGWSKINLKVYDIINCLNKTLITNFVWYLEKGKKYDIETFSIDRVLNKEHFCRKVMQKMCTKS